MNLWKLSPLLLFGLAACASNAQLTTADPSEAVSQTKAEVDSSAVNVTVKSQAWDDFPENLYDEVTPLYVTIENRTNEPIYFGYAQMNLVESDGDLRPALPLLDIGEDVTVRDALQPNFEHRNFFVMSPYQPYYPSMTVTPYRTAPTSPYDYHRYFSKWEVDLPTLEMIEQAIPEGVIDPGGRVAGFLYFEEVDEDEDFVTFTYVAHGMRGNAELDRVAVRFDVDEADDEAMKDASAQGAE